MPDGIGIDAIHDLVRFVGQTVTIFTSSGGLSGSGFTGILVSANDCFVRLITSIGAAPDCPVGSTCGYPTAGYGGFGGGYGGGCGSYGVGYGGYGGYGRSLLGSVVVIPVDKIVSFTHNAI